MVECPNIGCPFETRQLQMSRHTYSGCPWLSTNCKHPGCDVYDALGPAKDEAGFPKKDIEAHEKRCPTRPIDCRYAGCNVTVQAQDMPEHKEVCPFRVCRCHHFDGGCKARMKLMDRPEHELTCWFRKVACKNEGCGRVFRAQESLAHSSKCEHRRVPCRSGYCDEMVKWKDLRKHAKNCGPKVSLHVQCFKTKEFDSELGRGDDRARQACH